MTPNQLKKLERLAKVLDNGDVELLTQLDQLETKTEQEIQAIYKLVTEALTVAEQTKKLEGKQGIKGERGNDGNDGKNGLDGKNGAVGATGERGLDGKDGLNGLDGKDGKDGADGINGKDGFVDEATVGYLEEELKRIEKKTGGYGQVIRKLRAGNNISIDETNMEYPLVKVTYPYRAVTGAYTIASTDNLLDCNGTFTITLRTAVGFTGEYIIKNSGSGIITVATDGSETIDGGATADVPNPAAITLRSNGTNWIII